MNAKLTKGQATAGDILYAMVFPEPVLFSNHVRHCISSLLSRVSYVFGEIGLQN